MTPKTAQIGEQNTKSDLKTTDLKNLVEEITVDTALDENVEPQDVRILPLLKKSLFNKFSKGRTGIHVSDMTTCVLKAYYGKTQPTLPTGKDLGNFSSGNGIHDAIQSLTGMYPERFRKEKSIRFKGVEGHIDIFDTVNRIPIELKSTRIYESKEPNDYHVQQLKCYMAILDTEHGLLVYQMLLHKGDEPFVEYPITCDKKERSEILQKLTTNKKLLVKALEDKDPWDLPHVGYNPKYDWLCQTCSFFDPCINQRWRKLPNALGLAKEGERYPMKRPQDDDIVNSDQ